MRPRGVDPRIEGHGRPAQGVDRQGGGHVGGACQPPRVDKGQRQDRRGRLRPVDECEPFFRAERDRREPRALQRDGAADAAERRQHFAFADQHEREMRQRREVSAGADRAPARHDGMNVRVEQREQRVDGRQPDARVAAREHVGAEQHHRAHGVRRERLADAGRVAAQQVGLQPVERVGLDADLRERAEPGVDAVDGLAAGGLAIDDGTGAVDAVARRVSQRDVGSRPARPPRRWRRASATIRR